RYRRRHHQYPELFPLDGLDKTWTVYDFDDRFTAKAFGFGTAATDYATQSSWQFLNRIQVPTLMVQSQDDPLIPFGIYERAMAGGNPNLRLIASG
ncbi:hypothetical protein P6P35_16080, partial [Clostridium perfringens]|nr:hypothetical protein [Clostridium perfringens]